ncbi:MAG: epoxyqueuosine reductase QueH, partial [Elusimicrobiota bacterium]|nr:epoxyqueuosine reductase QueH [Elusimicrobiota bacterium]
AVVAESEGVAYDQTDWRKDGLEKRSNALIAREAMYRQVYCGCEFSQRKRQDMAIPLTLPCPTRREETNRAGT